MEYKIRGRLYGEAELHVLHSFIEDLIKNDSVDEAIGRARSEDDPEFSDWVDSHIPVIKSRCEGKFRSWEILQEECLERNETSFEALAYEEIAQMYYDEEVRGK